MATGDAWREWQAYVTAARLHAERDVDRILLARKVQAAQQAVIDAAAAMDEAYAFWFMAATKETDSE